MLIKYRVIPNDNWVSFSNDGNYSEEFDDNLSLFEIRRQLARRHNVEFLDISFTGSLRFRQSNKIPIK